MQLVTYKEIFVTIEENLVSAKNYLQLDSFTCNLNVLRKNVRIGRCQSFLIEMIFATFKMKFVTLKNLFVTIEDVFATIDN